MAVAAALAEAAGTRTEFALAVPATTALTSASIFSIFSISKSSKVSPLVLPPAGVGALAVAELVLLELELELELELLELELLAAAGALRVFLSTAHTTTNNSEPRTNTQEIRSGRTEHKFIRCKLSIKCIAECSVERRRR